MLGGGGSLLTLPGDATDDDWFVGVNTNTVGGGGHVGVDVLEPLHPVRDQGRELRSRPGDPAPWRGDPVRSAG